MLLLVWIFIPVVFAEPGSWTTLHDKIFRVQIDSNNILKSVKQDSQLSNYLNLSSLGLVGIDRKAFNDVNRVRYLNLEFNHLEILPQLVFLALENLQYLSLANNPLSNSINFLVGPNNLRSLDLTNIDVTNWNGDNYFGLVSSTIVVSHPALITVPVSSYENECEAYILFCMNEGIVELVQPADNLADLRITAENCERAELLDNDMIENNHFLTLRSKNIIGFKKDWYSLHRFVIKSLDLTGNKISRVTSSMLNDLPQGLTEVILSDNRIMRLKSHIIVNQNLKILDLKGNAIERIEAGALAHTSLVTLKLHDNKLTNNRFVDSLPSTLIELSLERNKIVTLFPNAFSRLNNLKVLSLAQNKLVSLEKNVFNGLSNIRDLSIADNKLTSITGESFRGLSNKMSTLLLNNNKIEIIRSGTFIDAPTLLLDLSLNSIKTIENGAFNLPELKTLRLEFNSVRTMNRGTLVSLPKAEIYLQGNTIVAVENGAA